MSCSSPYLITNVANDPTLYCGTEAHTLLNPNFNSTMSLIALSRYQQMALVTMHHFMAVR